MNDERTIQYVEYVMWDWEAVGVVCHTLGGNSGPGPAPRNSPAISRLSLMLLSEPHCCQDLFHLPTCKTEETDFTNAIIVLECRNDVIHVQNWQVVFLYDDGKGWPDIQHFPHRCCGTTNEIQCIAIFDTRGPMFATPPLPPLLELDSCSDQILLGGHRLGVC